MRFAISDVDELRRFESGIVRRIRGMKKSLSREYGNQKNQGIEKILDGENISAQRLRWFGYMKRRTWTMC